MSKSEKLNFHVLHAFQHSISCLGFEKKNKHTMTRRKKHISLFIKAADNKWENGALKSQTTLNDEYSKGNIRKNGYVQERTWKEKKKWVMVFTGEDLHQLTV